jgi:PAS domain S-box-containing protein
LSDETSKRLAVLETINRLNAKLRDIETDQEAFVIIASELKEISGSDLAAVVLLENGGSHLRLMGTAGFPPLDVPLPLIGMDPVFRKKMTETNHPVISRLGSQAEFPSGVQEISKTLGIEQAVACSVLLRGEFLGYLVVGNKKGSKSFTKEIEELLVAVADDISLVVESVRASLEVRRAKEDTDRMLALAPVGIFTCDSKGIFTSVNKQMMTIFDVPTENDLIRTSVFELPVISKSGLDALLMSGMEGHEGEKADVHMVPRPDKAFYLHVKVTPIKSGGGDTQGVLFVAMDITSKVRLQNQLERSYEKLTRTYEELERVTKMKTQFIDIVSHELRTPLTVMRGYIDLIESEYSAKLEPKFASRLKIIKANTDKLYGLVESMLDVSRLEKGSLQIHLEPVRVDAILGEIIEGRMHDADIKKQTLQLEAEGRLPLIMADRRRLKDVFSNLVDNALKYTQEGGRIQVSARDEGRMLHVWVKDNGVGIPLEALGKIFDRFHIVTSNDLSHQVDRLGLGLPIAKGIIEAHQGRIWVESQVGKGSVFHVDLPKEPPK